MYASKPFSHCRKSEAALSRGSFCSRPQCADPLSFDLKGAVEFRGADFKSDHRRQFDDFIVVKMQLYTFENWIGNRICQRDHFGVRQRCAFAFGKQLGPRGICERA